MEAVSLHDINARFGLIALQAEACLARVRDRERIARAAQRRARAARHNRPMEA
jgi:hypothetical protein